MLFVNRYFNAAIGIKRCAVLKTRPQQRRRFTSMGQPLKLEGCKRTNCSR